MVKLKLVEEVHSDYLYFFDEVIKEFEPQTDKNLISVVLINKDSTAIDLSRQTINNLKIHFHPIGNFEKSLFNVVASTDPYEPFTCVYFYRKYTFLIYSHANIKFDSKKSVEIIITENDLESDSVKSVSYYTMSGRVYKSIHKFDRDEH